MNLLNNIIYQILGHLTCKQKIRFFLVIELSRIKTILSNHDYKYKNTRHIYNHNIPKYQYYTTFNQYFKIGDPPSPKTTSLKLSTNIQRNNTKDHWRRCLNIFRHIPITFMLLLWSYYSHLLLGFSRTSRSPNRLLS